MAKHKSVWLIEHGSYSDYHIVGVFSTRENAELAASRLRRQEYDVPVVAEWTIDPAIEELSKGWVTYSVRMLRDGTVVTVERDEDLVLESRFAVWTKSVWAMEDAVDKGHAREVVSKGILSAAVLAKDDKHAVKIVGEHRARLIAEGGWLCED